jgi:hypothetical protein
MCKFTRFCGVASAFFLMLTLAACQLLDFPPNDDQALAGVKRLVQDSPLPNGFVPVHVKVVKCVKQNAPEGHVCEVIMVGPEMPVIGAVSFTKTFRFVNSNSSWIAYLS